ncbi:hypothetical protein Golomagni_01127 [Golovinomyces magnicellulatus]|nr:hypothetical protein Golomagni_01127 [Golovinomyces magnicellulatus]
MEQFLKVYTLETNRRLDRLQNMIRIQSDATTETIRECKSLVATPLNESNRKSPVQDVPAQNDQLQTNEPKNSVSNSKCCQKIGSRPTSSNKLPNCQDLQAEDLSNADTPTLKSYVKGVWPEALSSVEVNEALGLSKNATHKFSCSEEPKDTSADNWQRLQNIQRLLYNDKTPYEFWPSRIVGNLSGDFESIAKFIRYKNPSWLLTIEVIPKIMRNYNGVQPPIYQLA